MAFWSSLWGNMRTYVTDWYKSGVLQEHLTNQALAHRNPVDKTFFEHTSKDNQDNYAKNLPDVPTPDELFHAFMFSGVDYRGQAQHAFETLGYGAGVTLGVDLAKMFLPPGVSMFVTTSVNANFSAKKASHRFLYIANQGQFTEIHNRPSSFQFNFESHPLEKLSSEDQSRLEEHQQHIRDFETSEKGWQPIVMGCMLGKWTNMKGGIGVEVGAKFDTTNIANIGISDVESFGFSVKLTATASAALDGTWVLATDPSPIHTSKSYKVMGDWFSEHLKSTKSGQALKQQLFLDVNPNCYLSWWIHSKEASAGLNAGAGMIAATHAGTYNDQTIGPAGTLSFTVKLPSVKWTSKTSSYRLNTPCSNADIILSQETKILYKQLGGQLLGLALDLELGCAVIKPNPLTGGTTNTMAITDPQTIFAPKMTQKVKASPKAFSNYTDYKDDGTGTTKVMETVTPPDLDVYKGSFLKTTLTSKSLKVSFFEDQFKKLEKNWQAVNSMAYESGIAFWSKDQQQLIEGSGLVVGQSLTLASFIKYWSNGEQCKSIAELNASIPALQNVTEVIDTLIKQGLPKASSELPTLEDWLSSTDTGDWRRNITATDDALKAYWKHINNSPWNLSKESLLTHLKGKCKAKTSGTQEEKTQYLYSQLLNFAIEEIKTRGKLQSNIIAGIDKWMTSKGGIESAKSNRRFRPVVKLAINCDNDIKQLDHFGSVFDVLKEYFEMRTMEAGLSKSLHVDITQIRTFLADKGLQGAVQDLTSLQKLKSGQVPGAFLIEASFKLSSDNLQSLSRMPARFKRDKSDLENDFTNAMKTKLEGNYNNALQYISIRYRKSDTKTSSRSFKLGVSIGAANLGFSLDRVRQAGTEGNFMVSTIWFGSYASANQGGGWPEKSVPMPVILS